MTKNIFLLLALSISVALFEGGSRNVSGVLKRTAKESPQIIHESIDLHGPQKQIQEILKKGQELSNKVQFRPEELALEIRR